MVGDQLVPKKKLFGAFLCASGSELVAPLLESRRSLSPQAGVKNDADWRWRMCRSYEKRFCDLKIFILQDAFVFKHCNNLLL
jgi:hypothetical protein